MRHHSLVAQVHPDLARLTQAPAEKQLGAGFKENMVEVLHSIPGIVAMAVGTYFQEWLFGWGQISG